MSVPCSSLDTPVGLGNQPNVTYCINPECAQRQNPKNLEVCGNCGTPLLIDSRFRLLAPLRSLDSRSAVEVFDAIDLNGLLKVIKVLRSIDSELVRLFQREATILLSVRHPGIPRVQREDCFTVTPAGNSQRLYCLAMQKFPGLDLHQWLQEHGSVSQAQALNWLKQLGEIINVVHQAGFFHRDIKPSNIILQPNGRLALIDFGSGRQVTQTLLAKLSGAENTTGISRFSDVTYVGSPGYVPLEQFNGKAVPQSDFFALGRTLVHLMTGIPPHQLSTHARTGRLIWRDRVPRIQRWFANFIDELLAPFPAERPKNSQTLLRTLERLEKRNQLYRSPVFRTGVVVGVVLGVAALAEGVNYLFSQYDFSQASFYSRRNQPQLARPYLESYLDRNPQDADAYINLALACQNMQDYRCANDNYREALKQKPDSWEAHYNLGALYDEQGNFTAAVKEYEESLRLGANQAVGALNNLSRIRNLQRRYGEAEALAQQGLKQTNEPDRQAALYKNLGWAKLGMRQYTAANTNLWRALKLDPLRTDAYCLLAEVEEAKNNTLAASQLRRKCLQYTGS